ncbi:hypothetical protein GIB67_013054 [Kingdonia uniflora]|uniref:Carbohydrate kinase PfkB domain-containing protein n=1 Tax=Kingdonia uniflora TaxID=39325 RepID=A0A7J7MCM1_9MAGN|nr:hypothetical protein GIB67_013054 [Kingdonia uniflora]
MLTLSFDDLKLHQDAWSLKERYFANQNYMAQEGHYRYVYEAMLIETTFVQLEHHHINPKDLKSLITHSKCYVTRVLHLSEWGLDLTKSRTLSENILVFFCRNPDIIKRFSFPTWFLNWWEKIGPDFDVLPKALYDPFTLWYEFHPKLKGKTATNPPIDINILWYFTEFQITWIWKWDLKTCFDDMKLPILQRTFFYIWWDGFKIERVVALVNKATEEYILSSKTKNQKVVGTLVSSTNVFRLLMDSIKDQYPNLTSEERQVKVSDDEVAFLAHGDANDENNVLSLWYDGLKLLVVTDGKKGCRYFTKVDFLQLKTVDTTGAGDAFVGDFFFPYQRMKLTPHTDMGIEHLQHALEISPGNVAAYFGLDSRLLGLSKECVNNGAFSWGASLLKESSDVANASTVLTGKCFLHLEHACVKCVPWTNEQWTSDTIEMAYITSISSWKNKRLIRISAKAESAIHAQSFTAQTSFNSLMPKISQLRESVKSKRLQLINFNKTTTTSTIIQSQKLPFTLVNPARGSGRDLDELQTKINVSCKRINKEFGYTGYEPIVYIDKPLSISERIAFYSIAECVVVSAVRDGMNLTPYEYIVCRQGVSGLGSGSDSSGIKKKTLRYVSTHDVAYWSRSFMQDLERSCKDHFRRRCYAMGIGFGFRLVALDANFKKLEIFTIESAYKKSRNRTILLDYDGTVMPQTTINKTPSNEDCK